MTFHPGQHVFYVSGKHVKQGTITTGELVRNAIEARVEVRTEPDEKHPYRTLKLIRLPWILRGEALRCKREIAEAEKGIATDEGALIGLADWEQELRLITEID